MIDCMKRFMVTALVAVFSILGIRNDSSAQVRVQGTVITPGVRVRVGNTPTYYRYHREYVRPYYGYRRVYHDFDDIEYRNVWIPGYWNDFDEWVPGHYETQRVY